VVGVVGVVGWTRLPDWVRNRLCAVHFGGDDWRLETGDWRLLETRDTGD
jgi:hypothetical protein